MNWDDIRIFMIVADTGSLSAAAETLNISIATVSRRIDALEQLLGRQLMSRGRHGITLTPLGLQLLETTAPLRDGFDKVEQFIASIDSPNHQPPVRISATEPIISDFLAPYLSDLDEGISVDLISTSSLADLARLDADIAIRMFRPNNPGLFTQKVGVIELGLFASKEYLAGRAPEQINLRKEKLLGLSSVYGDIAEVKWVRKQNLDDIVCTTSSSTAALIHAAVAGVGIVLGSKVICRGKGLIEIPSPQIPSRELWMVSHADARKSPHIGKVKSWVSSSLKKALEITHMP
jgi:DNA-binding transcriptional LysR family regulator